VIAIGRRSLRPAAGRRACARRNQTDAALQPRVTRAERSRLRAVARGRHHTAVSLRRARLAVSTRLNATTRRIISARCRRPRAAARTWAWSRASAAAGPLRSGRSPTPGGWPRSCRCWPATGPGPAPGTLLIKAKRRRPLQSTDLHGLSLARRIGSPCPHRYAYGALVDVYSRASSASPPTHDEALNPPPVRPITSHLSQRRAPRVLRVHHARAFAVPLNRGCQRPWCATRRRGAATSSARRTGVRARKLRMIPISTRRI